jgi:ssDNA-binding replication factor A large subunit
MMEGNYERIIERIAKSSGIGKEEIEKRVEEKRSKLSGFISKEGAAQIVASELGISFESEKLKINELLPGMRSVNITGKVINLFPVRTFTTKRGEESKVVNFWIADDSSNIRVVLWDTNHVALIEKGEIKEGVTVEISNATMRDNELHLGNFSEIKPSQEILEEVVTEKVLREKTLSDFKKGENVNTRAFIVQAFEPRFFYVCPECGKKANQEGETFICETHEKVVPEKRAVITLVIDDGTGSMRAVLFQEALNELGFTEIENSEKLSLQKEGILGKEMVFSGNVRQNAFFNNLEFIVEGVKEVDLDKVIGELEK